MNGVKFVGDISVDEDKTSFVSNSCFTYPYYQDIEKDDEIILPVNVVKVMDGEVVGLNCSSYRGSLLTFVNGDGAYIPCEIIDSARLVRMPQDDLPKSLPDTATMVSNFNLSITKNGQFYIPAASQGSIKYANTGTQDFQISQWNGFEWVDVDAETYPFIKVFFSIPKEIENVNFSILYWNGTEWIDLEDNQTLDDGFIVYKGGYLNTANNSFEALVNFTGTFVLVYK